jgi:hypothetical protein
MQEAEIRRIIIPGKTEQKVCEIPCYWKKKLGVVVSCPLSDSRKLKIGILKSRPSWEKCKTLSPK